ncbi:MAG: hypothetical protein QMD46_12335 [Methanomicrobiales archaeon]|nr:hypothetical protein [Methanomicrobiales archaeon]
MNIERLPHDLKDLILSHKRTVSRTVSDLYYTLRYRITMWRIRRMYWRLARDSPELQEAREFWRRCGKRRFL